MSLIKGKKCCQGNGRVGRFLNKKNIVFFKQGLAFIVGYVSRIKGKIFVKENGRVGRFHNRNIYFYKRGLAFIVSQINGQNCFQGNGLAY